ncbi:MAG: N-acetylgalactosamine-6-sulfatase [Planctomycetota bacterium]|nr:MAG: N-acetylgalactosamine-6-sulfatase [Planctomycetota bacterium]
MGIAVGLTVGRAQAQQRPPNIIYLLLDDAGYGDLSCYGQRRFETPNIDRVAAEGMRFTQHYAGSTVCAPTRCCLMTGLHTGHAYVRGNREVQPEGQAPMPAEIVTIPRLLKRAGYATGAFGKWGLGAPGSTSDPARHFDEFFGYNCQRQAHRYYPTHLWHNFEKVPMDGKTHSAEPIMQAALRFVRQHRDHPFFLYLPVTIPHAAMQAPPEYAEPFRKKFAQFEDRIGQYAGTRTPNPIAQFAGMMTQVDDQVGELLQLLEELGLTEDTLLMISSDNGPHREGGHDPDFFDSNGPLRGYKRDLYEGGIRAPLIAKWPGHIAAGVETDFVCAHWDMLPTFCELAGIESPSGLDGVSIVPTLTGTGQQPTHAYLYWEFYEQGGKRAARIGNWKAVQLNLRKSMDGPIELYDLQQDEGETVNLADRHPEVVELAKKVFSEAHTPSPLWSFQPQSR